MVNADPGTEDWKRALAWGLGVWIPVQFWPWLESEVGHILFLSGFLFLLLHDGRDDPDVAGRCESL